MSLFFAIRHQIKKDTSIFKKELANEALRQNLSGRLFQWGDRFLPLFARSALSLLWAGFHRHKSLSSGTKNVAVYRGKRERLVFEDFFESHQIKDGQFIATSPSLTGFFFAVPWLLKNHCFSRRFRFLNKINRKHPLHISFRLAETFYFFDFFSKYRKGKKFYITTVSQPYASALMGLCRQKSVELIFKSHAPLLDTPLPCYFTEAWLTGEKMKQQILSNGSQIGRIEIESKPVPTFARHFEKMDRIMIGLSKIPDWKGVESLVQQIKSNPLWFSFELVLRPHPFQLSSIPLSLAQLKVESGDWPLLSQTILFLIAGESSIHLHSQACGIPSFYSYPLEKVRGLEKELNFFEPTGIADFEKVKSMNPEDIFNFYSPEHYARIRQDYYSQ